MECSIEAAREDVDQQNKPPDVTLGTMNTGAQRKTAKTQGDITTVAMVAVAIGFMCCENLMYIFIYSENNLTVGELP